MDENYYKQLCDLQAIDFVLVELTLYLDTHPNDAAALQQYNENTTMRHQMANNFQICYGPLMSFGRAYSPDSWKWECPPWPWQV